MERGCPSCTRNTVALYKVLKSNGKPDQTNGEEPAKGRLGNAVLGDSARSRQGRGLHAAVRLCPNRPWHRRSRSREWRSCGPGADLAPRGAPPVLRCTCGFRDGVRPADRPDRKQRLRVDSAGAIARAMERANQPPGFADAQGEPMPAAND
jgi:hypothetical protein